MRSLKLKGIIQYIIFLGVGILLIWYSARDLTPDQIYQIKTAWRRANLWYVVPVFVALLLSHLSRAIRWRILMHPLGYNPGLVNTFLAVLLGYFFNLLMPRLGEVMKCTVLAKHEKIAPDKLVGTILTERLVDMLCLLLLTAIMVVWQYDLLGSFVIAKAKDAFVNSNGGFSWIKIALIVAGIALVYFGMRYVFKRFSHVKAVAKVNQLTTGIISGIASFKYIENKTRFWLHTLFIWSMYLAGVWLGFKSFAPVSHLGIAPAVTSLVFGSYGMVLTQGGIGAFQIATEKALSYFGVNPVQGLSFGWLMWVAQTAIVIVSGIVALLVLPIYNERIRKKPAQPVETVG